MVDFVGVPAQTNQHTIGALRASFFQAPVIFQESDGWFPDAYGNAGTYASTQPVDEVENAYTATNNGFSTGFGSLFYNRIEITPNRVDFGNLITEQEVNLSVWNGYLEDKPLTGVLVDASGVTIDTPVAVPGTIQSLEVVGYVLTGLLQGDPTIDGEVTFTIDGEFYVVQIVGRRIVVFPFMPNWKANPVEELTWVTTVERSYDGDEQRRSMRRVPRVKWAYNIMTKGRQESANLENMLFGWQSRNFAVPIPATRSVVSADVALGATTIMVNTTDRGYYAGQQALLYVDYANYEAVVIQSVLSDRVTLATPTLAAWNAGTTFHATGVAHLRNQQAIRRETDFHVTASLEWMFEVSEATAHLPTEAAPLSYRTLEVWLTKFDWSQRPTFNYDDKFATFGDDGYGLLEFDPTSNWPTIIRQHQWLLKNRADVTAFRKFLNRRKGRFAPFWLPTWNDDFTVATAATATSPILTVRDNGYFTYVNAHDARRDIAIFLRNSPTPILRRINDVVDNTDGTVNLVLDANIGTDFEPSEVKRVCHLNLYRLGSDAVTLTRHSNSVAAITLNLMLVKG